jgi:hypothetical protein
LILKRHLSGVNIVVDKNPAKGGYSGENKFAPGRIQGSLYGQQKRLIADCVEGMRLYHERYEPVIFCLTSPGYVDRANEPKFLDNFLKQFRKNGLENYVWVRESTVLGHPHFHFVAECPFKIENINGNYRKILCGRDVVDWSVLWSSYFSSDSRNSIRLGADHKSGQVKYFVRNQKMSSYLCKYIGKGLGNGENKKVSKSEMVERRIEYEIRQQLNLPCIPFNFVNDRFVNPELERQTKIKTFGTSQRSPLRAKGSFRFIDPEIYEPDLTETQYSNQRRKILRTWHCVESPMDMTNGVILNDKDLGKLHWKQCGLHPVYMGFPKRTKPTNK